MPRTSSISPVELTAFHRMLHRWYKKSGRHDLPWRNTRDPYAIYISEIMLQQTQVKTVLERYYQPFLNAFPTFASLARADKQAVAKQWEGLGYYTRAANLHATAKQCGGALPETPEALQALPGIGRNTANAIACFAFRQAVPVMEANVRRVLCRVFALKKADNDTLWEKAQLLLDTANPFDYNQAMMDIGALICTKRNPRCRQCPLAASCKGRHAPASYPAPKPVKSTPVRRQVITALHDRQGRYLLQKRETRFLHGLYGFPEHPSGVTLVAYEKKYYKLDKNSLVGHITQTYSHFTLEADVHRLQITAGRLPVGFHRATIQQMKALPLSRVDHKVIALLTHLPIY